MDIFIMFLGVAYVYLSWLMAVVCVCVCVCFRRYFTDERALQVHFKGKPHKRRYL